MRDMVPIVIVQRFPPFPRGYLSDTVGHRFIAVDRGRLSEFLRETLIDIGLAFDYIESCCLSLYKSLMSSRFRVDSHALTRLCLHMVVRLFQRLSWNTRRPLRTPPLTHPVG